jgi:uncharacterized repeat protein (TIGR01451 family)
MLLAVAAGAQDQHQGQLHNRADERGAYRTDMDQSTGIYRSETRRIDSNFHGQNYYPQAFPGESAVQYESAAPADSRSATFRTETFRQQQPQHAQQAPLTYGVDDPNMVTRFAPAAGAVALRKHTPAQVRVGQDFEYRIDVINTADAPVHNVVVVEQVPPNLNLIRNSPQAQRTEDGRLRFEFPTLAPRETASIRIVGQAQQPGQLTSCATVTYEPRSCATIDVVAPQLSFRAAGPQEALLCERIPLAFQVTNTGTGIASNVVIIEQLPQGLVLADTSSSQISIPLGDIPGGATREHTVYLKALDRGRYEFTPEIRSASGLWASVRGTTQVTEPILAINTSSPQQQLVGTDVTYQINLRNTGDAQARDTVVAQQLPPSARFVSADQGGQLQGGQIVWNLGVLPPDASRQLSFTVRPGQTGDYTAPAVARAHCARDVDAPVRLAVQGIPALLLEVVDNNDPVRVGENTTYVINVVNQGSALDQNIRVQAELEPNMQFISIEGPTRGSAEGQTINFEPLPSLQPGARATWRLTVRAQDAGNTRFSVRVNSQQIGDRPVTETESTTLFR